MKESVKKNILKRFRKNKKIISFLLLMIVGVGTYTVYTKYKGANPDFSYKIVKIEKRDLKKEISIDGQVVSDYEIDLASEIPGIISKIYVKEGDYVKKGQLLMKLKDSDYRNQVNNAYVNQKINEASLEKVKNPNQNLDTDKAIIEDSAEIISANIQKTKTDIQAQIDALDIYLSQLLRMEIDDYFDHTDIDGTIYQPTLTYRLKSEIEISKLEEERKNLEKKYSSYKNSSKNIDEAISIIKDFEKMIFDLYKNSQDFLGFSDMELEQKEKYLSSLKNQISAKKTGLINLKTSLANLEKQLDSNKKSIEKVENVVNSSDLRLAEEKIKQARVQTNNAYLQLQKTNIRATRSGVIADIMKEVGEYAGPSTPLVKIISKNKYVKALVPEVDIAKIKLGMNVNVVLDAYKNQIFKGKIKFIYPKEKESQGINYYEIKIDLNEDVVLGGGNANKKLTDFNILPGMSLEVFIVYAEKKSVPAVKRGVAKKDDNGYYVQVINKDKEKPIDEKFLKRYFEYGFVGDEYIEVISEFKPNEEIIKITSDSKIKKKK